MTRCRQLPLGKVLAQQANCSITSREWVLPFCSSSFKMRLKKPIVHKLINKHGEKLNTKLNTYYELRKKTETVEIDFKSVCKCVLTRCLPPQSPDTSAAVCCSGLGGKEELIEKTWPALTVLTVDNVYLWAPRGHHSRLVRDLPIPAGTVCV